MYTFSFRGEILCHLRDFESEDAYIQLKILSMHPFYHELKQPRGVEKPLKGMVVVEISTKFSKGKLNGMGKIS